MLMTKRKLKPLEIIISDVKDPILYFQKRIK